MPRLEGGNPLRTDGFNSFNRFLRDKFGEKVYRVTIDGGFTCPNVDGTVTTGGCVYCDNRSFSPNRRLPRITIADQVQKGITFLSKYFECSKFIAYFQAATNTHGKIEKLERVYKEALNHPQVVGLAIGTRPDSVPEPVLELLQDIAKDRFVCLELGLQSAHDRSLVWMNRGHDVDSFTDAVKRSKNRNLDLCAHVILGLPNESIEDMLYTADYLSAMNIDGVKIHNLHVVRDTPMEAMYLRGEVPMMTQSEYVNLICDFLERLPASYTIHRLTGDAPGEFLVAPEWCVRKHEILSQIKQEFKRRGTCQGSNCDISRLAGSLALKRKTLPLLG
ncbi:MAG: TIGR01212 family radical SAM protein [Planctomycetes bacterium]|nr:TIGR01212 family radical SAM protein [Planctomycetota bacterium]NBY02895.1 TIGR01212 family radical SAM protein [Planctomycetota bacterium]